VKVRISETAAADLRAIGEYIGEDSCRPSVTFVRELREKCRDLGTLPHGWPLGRASLIRVSASACTGGI